MKICFEHRFPDARVYLATAGLQRNPFYHIKFIQQEQTKKLQSKSIQLGWKTILLVYMIGLPECIFFMKLATSQKKV